MAYIDLKALLRRWGRVFGVRPPAEWDEDSSEGLVGSTHALVRALRVATKNEPRKAGVRAYIAQDGAEVLERAPENVCHGRESRGGRKQIFIPPDAEAVELAVLDLYTADRTRAVILRMEYCAGRIDRREKAALAGDCLGVPMTTNRFRHELEFAHCWIDAYFAGQRAGHHAPPGGSVRA